MCVFGALMRFLSALGGTLSVLGGDWLVVFEFGAAAEELVSSRGGGVAGWFRHMATLDLCSPPQEVKRQRRRADRSFACVTSTPVATMAQPATTGPSWWRGKKI